MDANPTPTILKKGQKVRCKDPQDSYLVKGVVYTVESIHGYLGDHQAVYIEEVPGPMPFRADRFEPVEVTPWHPEVLSEPVRECPAQWVVEGEKCSEFDIPDADVHLSPIAQATLENCLAAEANGLVQADMVTMPKHYARFKIEPIRFICENGLNFFQGNIVKYTLRHDAKNGLEDLRKAKRYLEMFIRFQEGDPDWWK